MLVKPQWAVLELLCKLLNLLYRELEIALETGMPAFQYSGSAKPTWPAANYDD